MVRPDLGAVAGAGTLSGIAGALLTVVLMAAVGTLLVCAVVWAIATSTGNYRAASRARAGLWVAVTAAALAGAAAIWTDFLIDLGQHL